MKTSLYAALIAVVLFGLLGSVYVVREDQTALVLNLGRVARADIKPGLHFKVPLVESVRVFDRRFRTLETAPERYLTLERKDVSIDFFAVGYISDVRAFYRATGGDEKAASDRLAPIITDSLRNEINSRTLQQVVSGDRNDIVVKQLTAINDGAATLGVQIIDIRLKQIDLPTDSEVIKQVYERMRAQRMQVASKLRAEGEEQARTDPRFRRPRPDRAGRRGHPRRAEVERRGRCRRRPHLRRSGQPRPGLLRLPAQPGGLPRLLQRRPERDRAGQERPVPAVHEERSLIPLSFSLREKVARSDG